MKKMFQCAAAGLLLAIFNVHLDSTFAQGTAFTYQGRLNAGGTATTGLYDFRFRLASDPLGNNYAGSAYLTNGLGVTNGFFATTIDFGAGWFNGSNYWLEVDVKTNAATGYTTLNPLQNLTPTPYAVFAGSASNVLGTVSTTQLTGQLGNSQLASNSITVTAGTGLSGGGTVPLGGSTTLNNAGVVSVIGNADITAAAAAAGVVTLGDTATNANFPSTIVKRDAAGSFTNTSITLTKNLILPGTTASAGIIYAGGNTLLLTPVGFGGSPGSFFAGPGAGNLTTSGSADNTGVGAQALSSATGGNNAALGYQALQNNTSGGDNAAFGYQALQNNTSGSENTAIGSEALFYQGVGSSGVGSYNVALGFQSLYRNTSGSANTASGFQALEANGAGNNNTASGYQTLGGNTGGSGNTIEGAYAAYVSTTGNTNTADGYQSLYRNTTGSFNVADGGNSLFSNTTGGTNLALGYAAGYNLTTGGNNIDLGNPGVATDTNLIRIGAGQSQAFIAGVITGNGNGLTNLNAANIPGVVTNNEASVTVGSVNLPIPAALNAGANTLVYADNIFNFYAGVGAGNTTTTGIENTGLGDFSLVNNGSGRENTALGVGALNHNTTGNNNVALGSGALNANTTTDNNVAAGTGALEYNTDAYNTAAGGFALQNLATGGNNTALGYNAGNNLTAGTNNIYIGNAGRSAESGVIRIGDPNIHITTIIAGVLTGNGAGITNLPPQTPPPGMVLIPAGSFMMGDHGDSDDNDGGDQGIVYVSAFYMDIYLVTYPQWQSVYYWALDNGYAFDNAGGGLTQWGVYNGLKIPVNAVNWYDCVKWCNARSQQAGLTPVYYLDAGFTQVYKNGETDGVFANWNANGYRLPTEAEWEKAARGGVSEQRFPWGMKINENLANYFNSDPSAYDLGGNTPDSETPVGSYPPNNYGLYDIVGNMFVWCWDWYAPLAGGSDPRGPTTSTGTRVARSGGWHVVADFDECASRYFFPPNSTADDNAPEISFRCVRAH